MNIKKYIKEFFIGTKTMFKELGHKKTLKRQIANLLSFQRIIIPIIVLITALSNLPIISLGLVAIGEITDCLDGFIARKLKTSSEYGKLLDQITDKYYSFAIGIILSIINPLFIAIIALEGAISLVNVYYKKKYPEINDKSSLIGRTKQWILSLSLCTGFIACINPIWNLINNIAILTTTMMQTITLAHYAVTKYKKAKQIDDKIKNLKNEKENISNIENITQLKEKTLKYSHYKYPKNENKKIKIKRKD